MDTVISRPETTENDPLATSAERLKARARTILANSPKLRAAVRRDQCQMAQGHEKDVA